MTLQNRIKKVVVELEDIYDSCHYTNEKDTIRKCVEILLDEHFISDMIE